MSKATGYSLWLVPERESATYCALAATIREIARQYGTPVFEPHITLIGGISGELEEVRQKTRRLAHMLSPYALQLGSIGSHGTYFQILFSRVTQSEDVKAAGQHARDLFEVEEGTYFPHCSFAYGNLSETDLKTLRESIEGEAALCNAAFTVQTVELWRTEGSVEEWHQVESFLLGATP